MATYSPDADSYAATGGSSPLGAGTTMLVGYFAAVVSSNMFIRWDISSIPSTADITAASIDPFYVTTVVGATPISLTMCRVTADWNESEMTWFDRVTGTAWATPGGDYTTSGQGSVSITGGGNNPVTSNAELLAFVIDAHENRSGIVSLIWFAPSWTGAAQYAGIAAKEHGTEAWRPVLNVTYDSIRIAFSAV